MGGRDWMGGNFRFLDKVHDGDDVIDLRDLVLLLRRPPAPDSGR
jgi:hypothetical protein